MTLPLGILAVLSVVGGFINLPKFSDASYAGELLFKNWLLASVPAEAVKFSWEVAALSSVLSLLSLFVAHFLYANAYDDAHEKDPLAQLLGRLFSGMRDKWYVDELYQALIIRPYVQLSKLTGRGFDTGGIDMTVTSLGGLVRELALGFSGFQRGLVRAYAIVMVTGAVLLLAWFVGGGVLLP
jgi:NADH-quinone oxidoreductase subunit L